MMKKKAIKYLGLLVQVLTFFIMPHLIINGVKKKRIVIKKW